MTTDAVGGVWTFAADLAQALCRSGCEVRLVTMGPPPCAEQLAQLIGIDGLTIDITDLRLEWMDLQGADSSRASEALLKIEDEFEPDIVHLNGFREARFPFSAPVLVTAHSCVASWWQACRAHIPLDPEWRPYIENVAAGLDSCAAWVAPTLAYRAWLEAFYQPRSMGHRIYNGCDVSREQKRKQPFILAAGRLWDEAKNLRALGVVAPELGWPVRVAGPTHAPDRGSEARSRSVELLGRISHAHMIALMQEASIFVSPARYEPFGLTVLEAARCGCALVLSDIPTLRELWDGAALFVDSEDTRALSETLLRLCKDETLRRALQYAAHRQSTRYSIVEMADAYRALYDTLRLPQRSIAKFHSPRLMELSA